VVNISYSPLLPCLPSTFPRLRSSSLGTMTTVHQQLWKDAVSAMDKAQAIQTLSGVLADQRGRVFISRLGSKDAELCVEILDNVSRDLHPPHSSLPQAARQGIVGHNLKPVEKPALFITLRRLAERHGLLPDRIRIREKVEDSDEVLGSGGFGDVKSGTYEGRPVAVKIMRISAKGDFGRIRKVSVHVGHPNVVSTGILPQQFYKEVILWSTLSHPNVLGLVGAQEDAKKRQLIIVSERMVYGNIMKYINENHTNRLELVRDFALLTTSFTKVQW